MVLMFFILNFGHLVKAFGKDIKRNSCLLQCLSLGFLMNRGLLLDLNKELFAWCWSWKHDCRWLLMESHIPILIVATLWWINWPVVPTWLCPNQFAPAHGGVNLVCNCQHSSTTYPQSYRKHDIHLLILKSREVKYEAKSNCLPNRLTTLCYWISCNLIENKEPYEEAHQ